MGTHLGGCLYHPFGNFGLAANTDGMVLAYLLNKIVLVHRLYVMIDAPAIRLEGLNGIYADVFQQE